VASTLKIKEIYRFGPRKVSRIGKQAAVYLPKDLGFLRGRIVNVTIEVLDFDKDGDNDAA